MSRRYLTMLVLFAVVAQAALGGFGGGVGICFGGGHEHEAEPAITECLLACEHDPSFPAPVALDDLGHHDECSCTDVEIELMDLFVTVRGFQEPGDVAPLFQAAAWNVVDAGRPVSWCYSPRGCADNPACAHRLEVVRSTRLIL